MNRILAGAFALSVIAAPAVARDARLATRLYNPDEVVRIDGKMGVQASIEFADDEHIENVAIGDSNLWQVTPNKRANLLFVKPLAASARTNLTVVTDRNSYYFDLVASSAAAPLYVLRFTYPEPEKPATIAAASTTAVPALTVEESEVARGEARPVDPAALNFSWDKRGSARLLPARVYDDGDATYLVWSVATPVPAILVRNDKGDEGPVNFAVRDDVIVIDGVPSLIVLRSGKEAATLTRDTASRRAGGTQALAAASPNKAD